MKKRIPYSKTVECCDLFVNVQISKLLPLSCKFSSSSSSTFSSISHTCSKLGHAYSTELWLWSNFCNFIFVHFNFDWVGVAVNWYHESVFLFKAVSTASFQTRRLFSCFVITFSSDAERINWKIKIPIKSELAFVNCKCRMKKITTHSLKHIDFKSSVK